MVEAYYLLIAFGLGWWVHPDYVDSKVIKDVCPVEISTKSMIPMPPALPKDKISIRDIEQSRAEHRTALKTCNNALISVGKKLKEYNDSIKTDAD